jgi:HEAT repeat protein
MTALKTLVLAALAAIAPAEAGAADEFASALRGVEPELRGKQLETRAAELALLPGSIAGWLEIQAAGAWPPVGDGAPEPLSAVQNDLLARVAPKLAREEVLLYVAERLGSAPEPAWRGAALDLLHWHGSSAELPLLVDLVKDPDGKLPAEGPLFRGFQDTLVEIVRRDARIYGRFAWISENAPALYPCAVHALGLAGEPEALPYLAGMLENRTVSRVALQEISRLAPRAPQASRAGLADRVRPYLEASDKATRGHAIRALVALRDERAVPDLIAVVEGEDRGGRDAVYAGLRELTGQKLPEQSARWRSWYDEERRWLETDATAELDALGSADEARVVAAIRAISSHGLERDRLADGIVRVLREHPSAAVRAQACLGLERLRSRAGLDALAQALSDSEATVGNQALQALRSITGLDLPWDANAWRAALAKLE